MYAPNGPGFSYNLHLPSFPILSSEARSILSPASGFIAAAGFTHSLSPARNCTFACSYCYVPTLGIYGGLKPEDVRKWGAFTTYKSNSADLLRRELRPYQAIYCSPLVDPYQPAEATARVMPNLLATLAAAPPRALALQTRGPLVLNDIEALQKLHRVTRLRVGFSISTNRDEVRRCYESRCDSIEERWRTIRELRAAGIETYATLAPLLPCDPEELVEQAIDATGNDVIADPLHVRAVKTRGATTRDAARKIAAARGEEQWLEPEFQSAVVERMRRAAERFGKRLATGPAAFGWLAEVN